jgi:hypothetical protein
MSQQASPCSNHRQGGSIFMFPSVETLSPISCASFQVFLRSYRTPYQRGPRGNLSPTREFLGRDEILCRNGTLRAAIEGR